MTNLIGCSSNERMSERTLELLDDGRVRFCHGPIDVLATIEASGIQRDQAIQAMESAFEGLLESLVGELPRLRAEPVAGIAVASESAVTSTAQRMVAAALPVFKHTFVTPMAAVAGSVADTLLASVDTSTVDRLIINNGGDIAFHLAPGRHIDVGLAQLGGGAISGSIRVHDSDPVRGVATSGRRGRSLTLGIADSVTVLATTAAAADVAATVIASAVDLPGSTKVERLPASDVDESAGLGDRLVVVGVGDLTKNDEQQALEPGLALARKLQEDGLVHSVALKLGGTYSLLESSGSVELGIRVKLNSAN